MKAILPSLAVVLLLVVVNCQLSSADIACKKQTGCMCETDDFTIDISKAFDYPLNQSYTDDKTKKTYYMTFDCNSETCDTDTEAALCQYDPGHDASTSCGKSTEVTWTVTSRYSFKVLYQKGKPTSGGTPRDRQTEITFTAVNDTSKPATLTYQTEDDTVDTLITYKFNALVSAHSTGGAKSGGIAAGVVGIVLIVLVLVAIVSYFIIGAVVMATVKGARGTEMIPNYAFWKSLPGLLKDGCCLTIAPCKYAYEKKTGGGYQSL